MPEYPRVSAQRTVNGEIIPPQDRMKPELMTSRELLCELVEVARTIETAVIQLSNNPMFASMGAMFRE